MTRTLTHHVLMVGGDDDTRSNAELAHEAQPLRHALHRYFGRRVPDAADVEDLVQEVFARIVSRDSEQPVRHLAGYVYQTAASVLADRARRRQVRQADAHISFDTELHGDRDLDPERILGGKEDLRVATAALLSLPERTRTVFVLHRLEGLRCREVAVQLGISVSAVEKHMTRAIRHLSLAVGAADGS